MEKTAISVGIMDSDNEVSRAIFKFDSDQIKLGIRPRRDFMEERFEKE